MKMFLTMVMLTTSLFAAAADTQDPDFNKVFDRNKGGLYAIYSRALRDNPKLAGKIAFDVDIAANGSVTACRVKSSQLDSPDLDRKLCDRMSQMKFAPRASAFTATKTVEFISAM